MSLLLLSMCGSLARLPVKRPLLALLLTRNKVLTSLLTPVLLFWSLAVFRWDSSQFTVFVLLIILVTLASLMWVFSHSYLISSSVIYMVTFSIRYYSDCFLFLKRMEAAGFLLLPLNLRLCWSALWYLDVPSFLVRSSVHFCFSRSTTGGIFLFCVLNKVYVPVFFFHNVPFFDNEAPIFQKKTTGTYVYFFSVK